MELDRYDWHILDILQQDGRISNQDLADRIGLSPSPCLRRVRALEDSGLITGYRALLDARKGLKMFEKVNVPILGVVENMSVHVCSQCGHQEPIFGSGGGEKMAQDYGVNLLGKLPLEWEIRAQADAGKPTVVAAPDSASAQAYAHIARQMAANIAQMAVDYRHKFPSIVIQKT